jgi:hypothetical protein
MKSDCTKMDLRATARLIDQGVEPTYKRERCALRLAAMARHVIWTGIWLNASADSDGSTLFLDGSPLTEVGRPCPYGPAIKRLPCPGKGGGPVLAVGGIDSHRCQIGGTCRCWR